MPPYTNIPLSPAELSYLHTSLSQTPPIRPDGRSPTQFRPLVAETEVLPLANGSARVCFADGTEAVVGVKAEVERGGRGAGRGGGGEVEAQGVRGLGKGSAVDVEMGEGDGDEEEESGKGRGEAGWVELAIEIPGMRDDDALPVFLGSMLTEALLADGALKDRLWINRRFHWRLYIDILLLSQPLSYPLPLLSLTTYLALRNTRLPALVSEKDEDPLFNDDWEAATPLYPQPNNTNTKRSKPPHNHSNQPPITLLVISVGPTILFDPSASELAVADAVLAISLTPNTTTPSSTNNNNNSSDPFVPLTLRTIPMPSRLTAPGVPRALDASAATNSAGNASVSQAEALVLRERDEGASVWRPPRGGVGRGVVKEMVRLAVGKGGVGEEVLGGLEGVEV
ncbi:hypothetical protein MBLNU230_g1043t1 [Neophaeotheca triangularis]